MLQKVSSRLKYQKQLFTTLRQMWRKCQLPQQTEGAKSATRTKLGNFNPDEDNNLVKSWLEISCDPITSTG
jgi:hypothetical protein